jgi:hypothetical protein
VSTDISYILDFPLNQKPSSSGFLFWLDEILLGKRHFTNDQEGWLSPELYLRRPPSKNQQYRIDNLLQAAAQRGVKVNIIVYKEV